MKDYTIDLIKRFAVSEDISYIPAIIVGMQEEDNVGETVSFKNCFRKLRNIAAHEPATITSQLLTGDNVMNVKIVFVCESVSNGANEKVILDITQFTAWMFEMYLKTRNLYYLMFWWHLMYVLYPYTKNKKVVSSFNFKMQNSLIHMYQDWSNYRRDNGLEVKYVNLIDPFITKNLAENGKLFWRLSIPSMFPLLEAFITGEVSVKNEDNIRAYIALFKARE